MAQGDAGNLKIQQEINKLLNDRTALLAANQKALSGQVQTAIQLCKALKCEELDKIAEQMGEIDNATLKAAKAAEEYGNKAKKASEAAAAATRAEQKELEKKNKLLNVGKAAAVGAFAGLMSGVAGSINILKSLGKGFMGIIGTIGKVGKTILALPFKVLGGLVGMAQSGGGGGPSPIRLELEAIRKEYGSLASNEGKALASVQQQVQKASQNLGGTGLKLARVFGRGKKGVAEAMKQAGEIAKALGPAFNGLQDQFKKNAVELTMLTRGFTGSADATAAMMRHAKALGKDGTAYITEIAGAAQEMSKKFGISAKVIGKGMGEMMKNISDFGHMAKKEMLAAATYAGKLGLEIKDLAGVMNKFLNFEDAAEGAAQMAQAFGMNVDAMELMKGGPEAIDEMRRAFFESGKSLEDMSAAERKLLEQQTGLTGAALESAFAAESQGTSYKDMKKGADDAEKQAKTQTEVMNKLADSIDRVFGGGGGGKKFKSFFDAFVQGFGDGIKKSQEFRKLMKNIRKSLKVVYKAGKDVGKMFVKMFPGIQDMIKGTTKLFDPNRIKKLMNDVKKVFKSFFKDLETNPDTAVEKFFERMTKAFKKWFSASGPAAGQMKKGAGTFLKALGAIFKGLLTMALKGLTKLFKNLAEAIRNPPEVKSAFGEALVEFGKSVVEIFKALGPPLWEAMKELFMVIWEKLQGSAVVDKAMKILKGILITRIFLAAAMGAAKAAAGAIITNVIGPFIKKLIMGANQIPGPTGDPPSPDQIRPIDETGGEISGSKTNWAEAMKKAALMVVFIAVSIVALAGAFLLAAKIVSQLSLADIIKTAIVVVVSAAAMVMIGGAVKLTEGLDYKQMGMALLMMVGVIPVLGLVGMALGAMISGTQLPSAGESMKWGLMMVIALGAAGICIFAAGQIQKVINASGGPVNVLIGLGILGVILLALGAVGLGIGTMLGMVPNPGGVAKLMLGLAAIMLVTMLMLPVAGLLGMMLMSFPFGTAGVGILLAGFGVLGTLGGAMVGSLMPAIQTIAGLKIANPEHFKMVTDAIVAIVKGIAAFATAVARIMEAIDPGITATITGDKSKQLQESLKGVKALIDAIMVPIQSIIDKLIELASNADIEKENVEAIKAIAAVINAIANVMKAFSPSDAAFKAMEKAQGFFNPNGAKKLMDSIARGQKMVMNSAIQMIREIKSLIVELAKVAKDGDFTEAKPLLDVLPKILNAIAGLMKALSPSEGAMKAVTAAAETWGGNEVGLMLAMAVQQKMAIDALADVLPVIGAEMGKLVTEHLKPTIIEISNMDVDPAVIVAVGEMVAGMMSALGTMLQGVGPAMASMQESLETNYFFGPSKQEQMNSMMGDFAEMMTVLGTVFDSMTISIKNFVTAIIPLLQEIGDPERAAAQMDVVTQMVASLGSTIEPLRTAMDLISDSPWRLDAKSVYWFFGEPGKQDSTGLLAVLVTSVGKNIAKFINQMKPVMSKIGNPERAAAQMEVLAKAVSLLGEVTGPLMKTMDMIGKYKSEGSKWNDEVYWYFGSPSGGGNDGLLAVIVSSVGGSISNFMEKMKTVFAGISDPAATAQKMEIVAQSVAAMGTLLEMMSKAMALIVKHKDSSWAAEVAFYFSVPGGLMYQIANSLGSSLATIVTKIVDSVKGIENPKKAIEASKLVGTALEAVGTFAEIIQGFMKMKIKNVQDKSAKGKLNAIMCMVAGISAQLAYSMPQVITALLDVIEGTGGGISRLYKYRHSIKILGDLLCTVGIFADAITTMSQLGGSGKFNKNKVEKILTGVGDMFAPGGKAITALKNIILGMTEIPPVAGKINLVTIKKAGQFLDEMMKMIDKIAELGFDKKYTKFWKGARSIAKKKTGYIAWFDYLLEGVARLPASAGKINLVTMKKLAEFLECGMIPAIEHVANIPLVISDRVAQVEEAITMFSDLSDTISGKSFATAVKIGENLSRGGKSITFEHENVNINLTVQVDMSAEQLARGIVKTNEMKNAMGQGG